MTSKTVAAPIVSAIIEYFYFYFFVSGKLLQMQPRNYEGDSTSFPREADIGYISGYLSFNLPSSYDRSNGLIPAKLLAQCLAAALITITVINGEFLSSSP